MRHVAKKTNFSATSCVNTVRHFGREMRHFALVRHFALMRQIAVLQLPPHPLLKNRKIKTTSKNKIIR